MELEKIAELTNELREMAKNPQNIALADFCRKHGQLVERIYNLSMCCGMSKESANEILGIFRKSILSEV